MRPLQRVVAFPDCRGLFVRMIGFIRSSCFQALQRFVQHRLPLFKIHIRHIEGFQLVVELLGLRQRGACAVQVKLNPRAPLFERNGWYQITGGGLTGFMSAGYLSNMGTTGGGSSTVTTRTAYVNNPRSTQVLYLRETPSQRARALGQYKNGTQVKVVSYGATWCEVYVGTRHGYMMTRYLSFNSHYVTPTPEVIYVTPAPTPQIVYVTPTPTPLVQYITPKPAVPGAPESGTTITLAAAYGSASNTINVYYDQGMTSVRATYTGGKQATLLKYDTNVCMILVDGVVAYVSTWNVNY